MEKYTRVIVPVSKEEFDALRHLANRECREPKEQARYILRTVLLGEQSDSVMNNRQAATNLTETGSMAVVGINP